MSRFAPDARIAVVLAMLALHALVTLTAAHGQNVRDSIITPQGVCRVWSVPSPAPKFPDDAAYNQCAVDRRVTVDTRDLAAVPVRTTFSVHTVWRVVVNADGTLNAPMTTQISSGSDLEWEKAFKESMKAWSFAPAVRRGRPVRSAFLLRARSTGVVNDTLPVKLRWTYTHGADEDTIFGRWAPEPQLPALPLDRLNEVYLGVLQDLVNEHVVILDGQRQYCLVVPNGNSVQHARLSAAAQDRFRDRRLDGSIDGMPSWRLAAFGCERSTEALRIIFSTAHQLENGRIYLTMSGDYLPHYPPGLDGRSWRDWRGKCSGLLSASGPVTVSCATEVGLASFREWGAWRSETGLKAARAQTSARMGGVLPAGDSIRMSLVVTTSWTSQNDTLSTMVRNIPLLSGDPARYTVANEPHFKFRMADLRADTRKGKGVLIRLSLAAALVGVVPIATTERGDRSGNQTVFGNPVDFATWDLALPIAENQDATVFIYLVRR